MSAEPALDLDELFGMKEDEANEPAKTKKKSRPKSEKETDAPRHQGKPEAEPADSTDTEDSGTDGDTPEPVIEPKPKPKQQVDPSTIPVAWSTNIIGRPKGRINPYFEGVVSTDGPDGAQILVPYADITHMQRQVYVDDITLENPTPLAYIYRLQGSFPNVIVRIDEDTFTQCLAHPALKEAKVMYSWVSDHVKPRRNYLISHDGRPTETELKAQNKHMDEIEWALTPQHRKDELRKQNTTKYADMPEDEIVPLPAESEEPEESVEQLDE